MYDVHTVADAILKIAKKNGKELTPMQLMKLVYIAHGWSLAIYGSGLFSNRIEAWRYAPVIPDLYQSTKQFGRNSIPFDLIDDSEALGVSEKDESLLRDVFEKYGQFTGRNCPI